MSNASLKHRGAAARRVLVARLALPSRVADDWVLSDRATMARTFTYLFGAGATLLLVFPVAWMVLTALRPASGVFYVHRGTEFTLANFAEALAKPEMKAAFFNSACACFATSGAPGAG